VQIVPKNWVVTSVTPDEPHLMPEKNKFGYGYQWWIPLGNEGEFIAQGVYNQNIYINPTTKTVIVKNSANYWYNDKNNPYADSNTVIELFRKIAHQNQYMDSILLNNIILETYHK